MWIKQIDMWDDDEIEADVTVTDGKFELTCYALYCENSVGDVDFTLSPFDCGDVMTSEDKEYRIQKLESGNYDYKLQGKLIAVEKDIGTVQIGGIVISNVRYVPKDIRVGEFVEFTAVRIEF